jgi:hypothetical protein
MYSHLFKDAVCQNYDEYRLGVNLLQELELLPMTEIQTNIYIRHPVAIEQYLMEGSYNKVRTKWCSYCFDFVQGVSNCTNSVCRNSVSNCWSPELNGSFCALVIFNIFTVTCSACHSFLLNGTANNNLILLWYVLLVSCIHIPSLSAFQLMFVRCTVCIGN